MSGDAVAKVIGANRSVIVAGVQQRMMSDLSVVDMASARAADPAVMSANIVGFWLQGIETDLSLGSTTAMEQSLGWLGRMRTGQDVRFDDHMVARLFEDISAEIMKCLPDDAMLREYRDYGTRVVALISAAFPGAAISS